MLIEGVPHLTTLTADLDRLIGFYERRVFDARVVLDLEEEGLPPRLHRDRGDDRPTPLRSTRCRCSAGADPDVPARPARPHRAERSE